MSELSTCLVTVQSGSDIVETLQNFIVKHNLKAAFLIHCVGDVSKAKIRLAEATPGFEPVQDITGPGQINSLVGTLSAGGHLHISLTDKCGACVGGHVFGPLVASGIVKATVGDCVDLLFERLPDIYTGYRELSVTSKTGLQQVVKQDREEIQSQIICKVHQKSDVAESEPEATAGSMVKVHVLRLRPGEEIVESLKSLVAKENLKAAFIMTCVGSGTKAKLRLAHQPSGTKIIDLEGHYEIVSLVGTLTEAAHLHISLSDKDGHVIGGHVIGNLVVFTTAEIVVGECTNYTTTREMDSKTGFPELVIKKTGLIT